MAMQINTNILSMTAQRNVAANESRLGTAIERLSTGLRINSAGDDAAGLAISERFTSTIRGQTVAQRNANDAISLAQTAEGALSVMGDVLQRMRELTIQSLNEMNTPGDRAAIQREIAQLREEIERIAQDTTFNGKDILNGTMGALNFQIGSERGDVLAITGLDARATTLGQETVLLTGNLDLSGSFPVSPDDLTLNNVTIETSAATSAAEVVTAINDAYAETGVFASLDGSNQLVLEGGSIDVGLGANILGAVTAPTGTDTETVDAVDVSTVLSSNRALDVLDAAIDQVTSLRAGLGAMQNRFENVVEVISIHRENLEAARSRIRDADFAEETANLTRAQILQQAGLSSLAQANTAPQSVLSLLQ